jgi:hypothetical protein
MGELLVGGGLVVADAQLGTGRDGLNFLDPVEEVRPSPLGARRPPQLLPDPALAQRGDAGEPVAGLHEPVVAAAVLAQRFGAIMELEHCRRST